jgi:hypothetical protein
MGELMKLTKKMVAGIVGLLISAILGPIFVYEYTNRPIVDYKFGNSEYLIFHYRNETVDLDVCNRGGIDIDAWLVLTVENASIIAPQPKSYIQYGENETRVLLLLRKGATEMMHGFSLEIRPDGDPQTIVLRYGIETVLNFNSIFCDVNGIYPTVLTYNRTSNLEYKSI